jgi:2-keto-4-pentenoate hydratase/2-oxohepta-3-ene-1,7-dioic acid hydratase in catechol pathway
MPPFACWSFTCFTYARTVTAFQKHLSFAHAMSQAQVFSKPLYRAKAFDAPQGCGTLVEEADVATPKRRAVTLQVNGAEWLDLDARAREASMVLSALLAGSVHNAGARQSSSTRKKIGRTHSGAK